MLFELHVCGKPGGHLLLAYLLSYLFGWHLEVCGFYWALIAVETVWVRRVCCVFVESRILIVFIATKIGNRRGASDVTILVLSDALCARWAGEPFDFLFVFIRAFQNLQSIRYLRAVEAFAVAHRAQTC